MEAQVEKNETSLEVKGTFAAPVAQVYQAWTDPRMMDRWLHPGADITSKCTVDLRVGGRYSVAMHSSRGVFTTTGEYQEIIPNEKLVFTWQWQGDEGEPENEITLITLTFRTLSDNETELTLLHEHFGTIEERDSHADGWLGTYEQLSVELARGPLTSI